MFIDPVICYITIYYYRLISHHATVHCCYFMVVAVKNVWKYLKLNRDSKNMASHIGWYNMYMDIYMEDLYPQCTDEKKVTKILLNLAGRNIEIYNKYNKTETKKNTTILLEYARSSHSKSESTRTRANTIRDHATTS